MERTPPRLSIDVFGTVVGIGFEGKDASRLAGETRRAWSRCLPPANAEPDKQIDVHVEPGSAVVRIEEEIYAPDAETALELLTQSVTIAGLTRAAGRLLMLHACGLSDPTTGRTAVLVGPSGMGKSTACQLHGRRWAYVTDECVALDQDGVLTRYPKPLSLDRGASVKAQVGPDDLGLAHAPERLEPAAVLLLDRREGAALTSREVPLTEAVARLAEHTSYLAALPEPLQRLAGLVRRAGCTEVTYGSTQELAAVLGAVLGEEA
ncbi:hypothetical protein QWY28_16230 [Nocardioides sp. SOB77]|uniref:Aldolase n=1 Tax=Nocardioides oceani TaxID=3058369 RepID=A0ABT8FIT3_9ACTN|nr:hypothetical protein [Nocardioides oceani]MDN4174509.1 hypothetical protein [Nocardioides oceani]